MGDMTMLKHASAEVLHAGYLEASDCIDWAVKRITDLEHQLAEAKQNTTDNYGAGKKRGIKVCIATIKAILNPGVPGEQASNYRQCIHRLEELL